MPRSSGPLAFHQAQERAPFNDHAPWRMHLPLHKDRYFHNYGIVEKTAALAALAALAQESRLDIYRLLVQAGPDGLPAGHIGNHLGLPPATLAFHLKELKNAGLAMATRNGRSLIYAAAYPTMNALLDYLTENCCQGNDAACALGRGSTTDRPARVFNVLFLCTGNSTRSILAESLLRHLGKGRFNAFSAGSCPKGAVHPAALQLLTEQGLPTAGLRSKSWNEFAADGAPVMDFLFTVCDQAANEVCPIWPGQPVTAHWGMPDPAAVAEDRHGSQMRAFREAFRLLERRISLFLALPLASLDRLALTRKVAAIGHATGDATSARQSTQWPGNPR